MIISSGIIASSQLANDLGGFIPSVMSDWHRGVVVSGGSITKVQINYASTSALAVSGNGNVRIQWETPTFNGYCSIGLATTLPNNVTETAPSNYLRRITETRIQTRISGASTDTSAVPSNHTHEYIERINGVINAGYVDSVGNDVQLSSSTTNVIGSLYVTLAFHFNTPANTVINGVTINGTSVNNAMFDGGYEYGEGTLTKRYPSSPNTGNMYLHEHIIPSGQDMAFIFKLNNDIRACGFINGFKFYQLSGIDYAYYVFNQNNFRAFENGGGRPIVAIPDRANKFGYVRRIGTTVDYGTFENGSYTTLYTSTIPSSTDLIPVVSMNTTNTTVEGLRLISL